MQFIEGKNRTQSILFPQSLDQIISSDNEVRIIDLFVESINLEDFHFVMKTTKAARFLQELVFSFYYGIAAFIKAIICKTSHVFFSIVTANNFSGRLESLLN